MKEIVVKTDRLHISPLGEEALSVLYAQETDADMRKAYWDMLKTMEQLPGREEWGSEWRISLLSGQMIGGICFKGAPDADGMVEIGYGIDEAYRRKGYAAEAVRGMVAWAIAQTGVHCVVAQTEAGNDISQRLLLNNGFVRDGYGEEGPLYRFMR